MTGSDMLLAGRTVSLETVPAGALGGSGFPGESSNVSLGVAVALSVLLHAALVAWLPGMRTEFPTKEDMRPLEITLRFPPPEVVAAPSPPPKVEEARPEPPRPKESPKPKPKPIARPVPEPRPVSEQAPPEPAPPPPVVAVEPVPKATPPAVTVAVPPAMKRPMDDRLLSSYGDTLARFLAQYQHYPRIAQLRRWEGKVQLKVFVAKKGTITNVVVTESSGHEVLDQQAIEMVNRANPLPNMPEGLQGREFSILVPIVFRLERS